MAAVEDEMWFYRALHAHIERELMRTLGDSAANDRSLKILDAGCGTGGLIRRLEKKYSTWQWTGVDIEPLACAFARERCGATIHEGSVTALPFEDESFEAVVLADVLYHLDDDDGALSETWRVLKPGGALIVNVPAYRWLWSYHDVATHARRRYERKELRDKIVRAGFGAVRTTHWNALPLPLAVVRRKLLPAPREGSDVRLSSAPVEWALRAATQLESAWLAMGVSLPAGISLLAAGRKRT